jgi:arginine decarboxylase
MEVCDEAEVPHPVLVSESGRALTAHHSVLVFDVLGVSKAEGHDGLKELQEHQLSEDDPNALWNLKNLLDNVTRKNVLEFYHDAVQLRDEVVSMFNLGFLALEQRAIAERFFWAICRRLLSIVRAMPNVPDELHELERNLAGTYFCNFSLFQSLPDYWAINHQFPILPIHRLNEEPLERGILADITCDSDGKIDDFIGHPDVRSVLELHTLNHQPYHLGIFLVGAYQEILGDLHNLFGDNNAVHVSMDSVGNYVIEEVEQGDTVEEVLRYVSYDKNDLINRLRGAMEEAVRREQITLQELRTFMQMYREQMDGYTYLEG